jgi:hypothetical protein
MADQFMFGQMNAHTQECIRQNLDRVRLDFAVIHFGVACTTPDFVRTFYMVSARNIENHRGKQSYFVYESGRTDL